MTSSVLPPIPVGNQGFLIWQDAFGGRMLLLHCSATVALREGRELASPLVFWENAAASGVSRSKSFHKQVVCGLHAFVLNVFANYLDVVALILRQKIQLRKGSNLFWTLLRSESLSVYVPLTTNTSFVSVTVDHLIRYLVH